MNDSSSCMRLDLAIQWTGSLRNRNLVAVALVLELVGQETLNVCPAKFLVVLEPSLSHEMALPTFYVVVVALLRVLY